MSTDIYSIRGEIFQETSKLDPEKIVTALLDTQSREQQTFVVPLADKVRELVMGLITLDELISSSPLTKPEQVVALISEKNRPLMKKIENFWIKKIEQKIRGYEPLSNLVSRISVKNPEINIMDFHGTIGGILLWEDKDGYNIGILMHAGLQKSWEKDYLSFLNKVFGTKLRWDKNNITVTKWNESQNEFSIEELFQFTIEDFIVCNVLEQVRSVHYSA